MTARQPVVTACRLLCLLAVLSVGCDDRSEVTLHEPATVERSTHGQDGGVELDDTILRECGEACPNKDDYWQDYAAFIVQTLRDRPSGLIMSAQDALERALFATGHDDCTGALDLLNPGISGAELRADLLGFRERIKPFPNFSTFFPDSDQHAIAADSFYTASANGVRLVDWFRKIVNGESPGHAGP